MSLGPRWKKVVQDLWRNKSRTVSMLLLIAMGVFAVGFVAGLMAILVPDMLADFQASLPAEARLYTAPFDADQLQTLRKVPGVAEVDGRGVITGRLVLASGRKFPLKVESISAPGSLRLNRLSPVGGDAAWPALDDHTLVLDYRRPACPRGPETGCRWSCLTARCGR
jgi:putative ABC transport system permease protein